MSRSFVSRIQEHKLVAAVVVALVLLGVVAAVLMSRPSGYVVSEDAPTPWDARDTALEGLLGGDGPLQASTIVKINAVVGTGLTPDDSKAIREVAGKFTQAWYGGVGRDTFKGLFPPRRGNATTSVCTNVDVVASAPMALEGIEGYAKAVVLFSGRCDPAAVGQRTYTAKLPAITSVYLKKEGATWVPVWGWQVPHPLQVAASTGADIHDWELAPIACGVTDESTFMARIVVADSFNIMCQDALKAGVNMTVVAALRTPQQQKELFDRAVDAYGSVEEARKHVAFSNGERCESRACDGLMVAVATDPEVVKWLGHVVGCSGTSGVYAASSCKASDVPITRSAQYGFARPLPSVPGYLEYSMVSDPESKAKADCSPVSAPTPSMVALIFRCRLSREGIPSNVVNTVVAEALVVSRCESGWNSSAQAFGGSYATSPSPVTNRTYTNRGVFGLDFEQADAGWVFGGRGNLMDPVANVNAAASLWLATHSWEQFGCAVGGPANGFEPVTPALPQYGGPKLPAWSFTY